MPLGRAAATLVSVSALHSTSSGCAGRELPGVNPGKAAEEAAQTNTETSSSTRPEQLRQLIMTKTRSYHFQSKLPQGSEIKRQFSSRFGVDTDALS